MVELKKIGRDYNFAVFKDGVHVDALVTLINDPTKTWRLWKDKENFTDGERLVIQTKLDELNATAS